MSFEMKLAACYDTLGILSLRPQSLLYKLYIEVLHCDK